MTYHPYMTFAMPTIDTGEFIREKYNLTELTGLPKKIPVRLYHLKKILARVRLFDPHKLVCFNYKRHYINDLSTGVLTVNVCVKGLTTEQVSLIMDAGDDVKLVETPENYKNF